jgi:TolB-like protein
MKSTGLLWISCLLVFLCVAPMAAAESELAIRIEELADKLTSSTSGEVIALEGQTTYINLGEKECIYEGCEFEVVRAGDPIAAGKKLFHKERPVAEIQVTKVRKEISLAKTLTSFGQIQVGDKVYQKRKKVSRIGLTEFPYRDSHNDLTRNIYEGLSVLFAQKGMQVVERSQLEEVLNEQRISYSGAIDIGTAQKLGQLLGTQAVLVGSITDMGNSIAVRARLVDVGKGIVLTAAQVEMPKTPEVLSMLDIKPEGADTATSRRPLAPPAALAIAGTEPTEPKVVPFENDFVRIEVVSLSQEPEGLVLKLSYFNKSDSTLSLALPQPQANTSLVDEHGTMHRFKSAELINFREFPSRSQRSSRIVFHQPNRAGKSFTFTAKYYDGHGHNFYATIKGLMLQ